MAGNREHLTKRKKKITVGIIVAVLLLASFLLYYFGNFTAVEV
ncbi:MULTISPECIES: hypothetical protein [Paenibacillus]|uniref:Uncharacterized protein n=1 Tax=Paenibacillus urinalis TaxID=521520 RepID=A0AAX3N2G7_9BACL|nr:MULTISPECIES: hypothetical protein [Paenibacillus]WDH84040.1 hypothetical protein PUW23_07440 [Paenibacillus urinalis]